MNTTTVKENIMGTMPMPQLLLKLSLPTITSMTVQALYNIVDSIFVSRISEQAFTAVSLAFPLQNLMISVAVGTGIGLNAVLSRSLGAKKFEDVNIVAGNGIIMYLLNALIFLIIGLTAIEAFFLNQTDDIQILNYGIDYLRICTIFSFALFGQMIFSRLLQATGKTFYMMIVQLSGAIINIILDPLLIFGIGIFPEMGTAGAAYATIIGQLVGFGLGLYLNFRYNKEILFKLKYCLPNPKMLKKVYTIAIPSIIMQSIGSIMVFGFNKILLGFGDVIGSTATAVFGAFFRLQSFVLMPVFGLGGAVIPIIGYNYGALNKERIITAMRLAIIYSTGFMMLGFLIFQIFPGQLLAIFDASEQMLEMGIPALRILSSVYIIAGYCVICSIIFQALGKGFLSLYNTVIRQLLVILPSAYLLSLTGNINLVWLSFPISEVFSVLFSSLFLRHIYRTTIKDLG